MLKAAIYGHALFFSFSQHTPTPLNYSRKGLSFIISHKAHEFHYAVCTGSVGHFFTKAIT